MIRAALGALWLIAFSGGDITIGKVGEPILFGWEIAVTETQHSWQTISHWQDGAIHTTRVKSCLVSGAAIRRADFDDPEEKIWGQKYIFLNVFSEKQNPEINIVETAVWWNNNPIVDYAFTRLRSTVAISFKRVNGSALAFALACGEGDSLIPYICREQFADVFQSNADVKSGTLFFPNKRTIAGKFYHYQSTLFQCEQILRLFVGRFSFVSGDLGSLSRIASGDGSLPSEQGGKDSYECPEYSYVVLPLCKIRLFFGRYCVPFGVKVGIIALLTICVGALLVFSSRFLTDFGGQLPFNRRRLLGFLMLLATGMTYFFSVIVVAEIFGGCG